MFDRFGLVAQRFWLWKGSAESRMLTGSFMCLRASVRLTLVHSRAAPGKNTQSTAEDDVSLTQTEGLAESEQGVGSSSNPARNAEVPSCGFRIPFLCLPALFP